MEAAMAWREVDTVSLRREFVRLAQSEAITKAELCRRFAISRKTGYKWLRRVRADGGDAALEDRSRRPQCSPGRTSAATEEAVLALRQRHPAWGPRKLQRVLLNEGHEKVPAVSTMAAILKRHGLIDADEGLKHCPVKRFEHDAPNDLWQMDYLGHFAIDTGRCHSLTALDDHSRYGLLLAACGDETTSTVQQRLTGAFRRYGLPWRMTMDNGSPWGNSDDRHDLTPLVVWMMRLGIAVSHSRPYHPQTQGKDERFHRTLRAEVLAQRRFKDLAHVQRCFDEWRELYNTVRPHQALGMQVPQQRYRPSPRPFPERLPPLEYGPDDEVRSVQDGGWISFHGRPFRIPRALRGEPVAVRATASDGAFDIYFGRHRVAQIDLRATVKP
jgi:transposase InsO family protein